MKANLCTGPNLIGGSTNGLADDGAGNKVVFGNDIVPEITDNAPMENVRLGSGDDVATGCGLDNTYSAGGGFDALYDYGGFVSSDSAVSYPKSDAVYSGVSGADQPGIIFDVGGQDAVNLKPLTTHQVDLVKQDTDRDGTIDQLVILTGPESYIVIRDANNKLALPGMTMDGRIEKVIFKNKTVSSTQLMGQAVVRSSVADAGAMAAEDAPGVLEDPAGFLEEAQLP